MVKLVVMIFGLLDLLSFVLASETGIFMFDHIEYFPLMSISEIILIVSLLATGVFSILRKKIALKIYYFQFPLRIAFMILTFGFILKIFGFLNNSIVYKVLIGLTFILELTRLVYTIVIHKRKFQKINLFFETKAYVYHNH